MSIRLVQERLRDAGFDPGLIDNRWGKQTGAAFDAAMAAARIGLKHAGAAAPPPALDPGRVRLSPNFYLDEFLVSSTAEKLGLANTPTPKHLANLKINAAGMEAVREICGGRAVVITSAYRNPQVNAAVGGTTTSDHPNGWATDFRVAGLTCRAAAKLIRDSDLKFDQLILESGRNIVHISFAPRMRRQVGTQAGGPGSPIVWRID